MLNSQKKTQRKNVSREVDWKSIAAIVTVVAQVIIEIIRKS